MISPLPITRTLPDQEVHLESIPFAPPYIDDDVIAEVVETLRSGWITTGSKVRSLEKECVLISGCPAAICVNSWTSGALLALKWWGIGPGDEVIVPAYTYAATALVVLQLGAHPVMVDVGEDLTMNMQEVQRKLTVRTKVIIPVDVAGLPCDYKALNRLVRDRNNRKLFVPKNELQEKLGRILVISDAAHSLGAAYGNEPSALQTDITIFSFHAVKNVTTAEGGAVCLNLPTPFDNQEVWQWMKLNSMNGQTKDAFSKTQAGNWRYDIVSQGLKINMPDICAALGLSQIRRYVAHLLPARKRIFQQYGKFFSKYSWAEMPSAGDEVRASSCHLYPLRIRGVSEDERDEMIAVISSLGVAVNVHFLPLPMLTLFKNMGYRIAEFPCSYDQYSRVITLPIYPQLNLLQVQRIVDAVAYAFQKVVLSNDEA
jgi:dTDP-4-amino-4,6-dideoxygalactose transaminase